MFPSAAEREQWAPRFDSPPSTSAAASPANATGRKRKANFSNDETETLVWNVARHFAALYGSEAFRAHPVRRKQLWAQIQSRVNFLGYTERSIDDLKHKWRDLRLDVKKKLTPKKFPPLPLLRPGPAHKPRLTPLEKMVASTFLQPTHDSEPEIVLDPEIFFPGASKPPFLPTQPGASHAGIYIDTNGHPSSLPDLEGSAVPHLGVRSPGPSVVCDYSRAEEPGGSAELGPELRSPDRSTASPPARKNGALVSYASEEEDEREGHEAERRGGLPPGLEASPSAEEDGKRSGRQAGLLRRCGSQGSVASVPEEVLGHRDPPSDWGHERPLGVPALGRGPHASLPEEEEEDDDDDDEASLSPDPGSLLRGLVGPTREKPGEEPLSRSPVHAGESPQSSASPQPEPVSRALPRRTGCPRRREGSREAWRTNLHRLMDMEDQWEHLYHQELATWQEERAQQREERARDRELQFRLLAVLTDIRDELRHLRQERAATQQERPAGRQERASQTPMQAPAPEPDPSPPKPEGRPAEVSPEPPVPFFPPPTEGPPSTPAPSRARRGEGATVARSPRGVSRRGRGRPRGSALKHRRSLASHS